MGHKLCTPRAVHHEPSVEAIFLLCGREAAFECANKHGSYLLEGQVQSLSPPVPFKLPQKSTLPQESL